MADAITNAPIPGDVDALGREIVDAAIKAHRTLGPGLLESVYEQCLVHEFNKRGLKPKRQVSLPIVYDGTKLDAELRIDLLVSGLVIIEVKAAEALLPIHQSQLLTYLKLSGCWLGFLINFNVPLLKDGIRRLAV
jgi:GxxExxY protein